MQGPCNSRPSYYGSPPYAAPKLTDAGVWSRIDSILGKKAIVVPDVWRYSDGSDSALTKFSELLFEHDKAISSEEVTCFVSVSDDDQADEVENWSAEQLNTPELASAFMNRYQ